MKNHWLLILVCWLGLSEVGAQEAGLEQRVDLSYQQVRLGRVLKDISKRYSVRFTYSRDFIPVGKKMSLRVDNQKLGLALDELFAPTQIRYLAIGDQIVLKRDPNKKIREAVVDPGLTGSLDARPGPSTVPELAATPIPRSQRRAVIRPTPMLRTPTLEPVEWPEDFPQPEEEVLLVHPQEYEAKDGYTRIAQFSVLPDLGTNMGRSQEITNKVSINALWGRNGGVNGVEVGGLVNIIEGDVNGLQIAGLANVAKGDLDGPTLRPGKRAKGGLQIAGISNVAASAKGGQLAGISNRLYEGDLVGFQGAGLSNKAASRVLGWQLAGLRNKAQGPVKGTQAAGLYNYAGAAADVQVAGLFNIAEGDQKVQVGALLNTSYDGQYLQLGMINSARNVRGLQLGLVNFADSVSGAAISLLTFVRHGYNHVEVNRTESMDWSLGVQFGSRHFYNIIEVALPDGASFSDLGSPEPTWALGYGIGTAIRSHRRLSWQVELFSQIINEWELWSSTLNQLHQFRLLFDWKIWSWLSLRGGPTVNLFYTQKFNPDTQTFDSQLLRESNFYESSRTDTSPQKIQAWIGYKFGVRF